MIKDFKQVFNHKGVQLMCNIILKQNIKMVFTLLLCFMLNVCSSDSKTSSDIISANTISADTIPMSINSIKMGPMSGDMPRNEFSVLINFKYLSIASNKWTLGFYMQRSFKQVATQNYNPNLKMLICDSQDNCTNLTYLVANSVSDTDLSQGYTTILAPSSSFALNPGQTYIIKLLHNNQYQPTNISGFPQNFFLTLSMPQSDTKSYNIPTSMNIYSITNYDQALISNQTIVHNQNNWNNSSGTAPSINVIPSPVSVITNLAQFNLANNLIIHNEFNSDNTVANIFARDLQHDLHIAANIDNLPAQNSGIIIKKISDPSLINGSPEGYHINITNSSIIISVENLTGAYYALQTLRQLWSQNHALSGMDIIDFPRFKYRGVLIDLSRHYFTPQEIYTLIDILGVHKINTLHLHFADDEGFRLILNDLHDSWRLQSIGDMRGFGQNMGPMMFIQGNLDISNYMNIAYPDATALYIGSYSTTDIQSIIAYANANMVTVIPEIDLPGHSRALIKSLPEVFVDPNDHSQFISVQGYTDDVIPVCTYNSNISVGEQFTTTINAIVNQIATLFNNQTTYYAINNNISVSGDEVSDQAWTADTSCRGIWNFTSTSDNPSSLQKSQYFFQQMAIHNPNLIFSGWQQAVQTEGVPLGHNIFPAKQVGYIWVWNKSIFGIPQAVELANHHYPTVLAFSDILYSDLAYTHDISEPGLMAYRSTFPAWSGPFVDTHAALSSTLSAATVMADSVEPQNIQGLEATLWSENNASYDHLMYMALPKMAGLSEAAWSPIAVTDNAGKINWQSLSSRLGCGKSGFLAYLYNLFGVHYRGYPNGISLEVPHNTLCRT